ncbi:MAG: response regulator [Pirellulaceae bacterium]
MIGQEHARVLIADDSHVIRALLREILESAGYLVTACAEGEQAWRLLETGRFQLALLDWLMPGLSGLEICRRLGAYGDRPFVYVVMLTSRSRPQNIADAFAAGASDHVVKPFEATELLARLEVGRRFIRFQTELQESQRLASIGELAAEVCHEIKTPLHYIGDNVQFLQDAFGQLCDEVRRRGGAYPTASPTTALDENELEFLLSEVPKSLQQTLDGIERLTETVCAIKNFAHPASSVISLVDVHAAIDTAISVARNEWKHVAEIVHEYDADLPLVPCIPSEFSQAVLNLIVNAAHAIADTKEEASGEKGVISIHTRRVGNWAEVEVSDTGCGIPEEIRPKIFQRYFTTKEIGRGTGQGLAIVRNVVAKHRGDVHYETEVGKGTIFRLRFPLTSENISPSETQERSATSSPSASCENRRKEFTLPGASR